MNVCMWMVVSECGYGCGYRCVGMRMSLVMCVCVCVWVGGGVCVCVPGAVMSVDVTASEEELMLQRALEDSLTSAHGKTTCLADSTVQCVWVCGFPVFSTITPLSLCKA